MNVSGCSGVTNYLFDLRYLQAVVVRYAADALTSVKSPYDDLRHNPGAVDDWSPGRNFGVDHDNTRRIDIQISWPIHPYREKLHRQTALVPFDSAKIQIENWPKSELSPTRHIYRLLLAGSSENFLHK